IAYIGLGLVALTAVAGAVVQRPLSGHWLLQPGFLSGITLPTLLVHATSLFSALLLVCILGTWLRRWRSSILEAGLFALALGPATLKALGEVTNLVPPLPSLLGLLLLLPGMGMVGSVFLRRTQRDAEALERLSRRQEPEADERTSPLGLAQSPLARSERLAALGHLAGGVAHQINNPAAAVSANLDYLLREQARTGGPPEDYRECLEDSCLAIKRIARVVRQLLDTGHGARRALEPVSVPESCAIALSQCRSALPTSVHVDLQMDSGLRVLATERVLVQALTNLLLNAAQAIGEAPSGHIVLRGEHHGDLVVLTVADSGPEIPEEQRPRLFEPFSSRGPHGAEMGLGLAASLGLVRALGGKLELRETSSRGTIFEMRLAAAESRSMCQAS
ncbi:MAG: hypothetical protein HY901_25050, partial [Deltaproteobacteria bacterium]|nr:hypothetical protein [Deltaproteobacteria bacterium]